MTDPLPMPTEGLAARLAHEDLSLGVFTDEELVALEETLAPTGPVGWFATLAAPDRSVAQQAALRSLLARGVLRPGARPSELEVHPSLQLLRSSRDEAAWVLHARRSIRPPAPEHGRPSVGDDHVVRSTAADEHHDETVVTDHAILRGVSAGVVLEELISPDGLHACTMRSPDRSVTALGGWCDPTGAMGPTVPAHVVDPVDLDPEVLADGARVHVAVTVIPSAPAHADGAAGEPVLELVVVDDVLWHLAAAADGSGTTPIGPVTDRELTRLLTPLLADPRACRRPDVEVVG